MRARRVASLLSHGLISAAAKEVVLCADGILKYFKEGFPVVNSFDAPGVFQNASLNRRRVLSRCPIAPWLPGVVLLRIGLALQMLSATVCILHV